MGVPLSAFTVNLILATITYFLKLWQNRLQIQNREDSDLKGAEGSIPARQVLFKFMCINKVAIEVANY